MKKSMTAKLISVAAALACIFAAGEAQANGIEPTVVAGQASFSTAGSSLSITNSPGAIINWQGFSISAGETTRFTQQSAASSVLNRVIGSDPSVILGSLTSNGRVFLINPGGILFGQGARIDVAGLVASTLNLSNQDFLAGRLNFTANPLAGNMENQGSITTPSGGSVYLLGANVSNSGIINSPQGDVILAAGQSVNIFDSSTPGVRVELTASDNAGVNLGEILAQSGQVGIYGAALRNSGLINADQVSRDASGKIVLRAKQDITLEAGSRLSANGEQAGAITVQSDAGTTLVSGTIEAKGTGAVAGNGGTIKLLGDMQSGTVNVGGTLDASASMDGNGGFIETSAAHVKVTDDAIVTTQSAQGKSGTWLIDPIDFTVATGSGGLTASGIGASTLSASLGTGNVSIATNATTTGNGDIFVNDVVSWTANTLTLTAHRNININAAMTASTGASLALNPGTGMVVTGRNSIGNFIGRVDFSGTGTLAIGGTTYTVINSLGNENSTTGLDLQGMNGNLAGNYALGADIDATATGTTWATVGFVPIGTFTGTFDGLGHTINSLRINSGAASAGLFGATGTTSTFNNVGLVGGSVTGAAGSGGLIGTNGAGSTVNNSYNTGNVSGSAGTGGLVGDNTTGAISNSYSTGTVTGASGTGGLIGTNTTGAISNSYSTGTVTGSNAGTGGLVGSNTTGTVSKSYATGSVTGTGASTGGLLGSNGANTVSDSYATGNVSGGGSSVGGLIGSNDGAVTTSYSTGSVSGAGTNKGALVGLIGTGTVTTSFWNSDTSITQLGGGRGMTTAEMQTQANFTSATTANGSVNPAWGFPGTWVMYDGYTYPLLQSFMTPLTVTANNFTKTYNGVAYSGGNGVTPTPGGNLLGTVSYSGTSQGAINVSNYVITPSGLYSNQQGYIISYADGSLTIDPYVVNLTGTRAYDGTLNVAAGVLTIGTLIGTETLNLAGTGTVASKNVGTAKTVTLGTLALSDGLNGGLASNYTFTGGTQTTNVTQAPLTLSASNVTKTYDGSLTAVSTAAVTGGSLFTGDTLSGGSFAFTDKNVGSGNKTVTAAAVTVNDTNGGGNYAVSYANNITSTIDPYVVNLTGTKVYDTNTTFGFATFGTAGTISTGLGTETLLLSGTGTVVSKNVAAGSQTVTLGSLALNDVGGTGGLASNYTFTGGTQTATVTVAPVSFTGTKVYDTNTNFGFATFGTAGTISALGTETLLLSGTGTVASKNVSAGSQTVTTAGLVLNDVVGTGGLASNYTFTGGTQTAAVTVAPVSFTGTKVYDTNTNFGFATFGTAGTISALGGETLLLSGTGTVADKNVSAGSQTVTTTGLALNDVVGTGGLASNYTFTSGTQTANITALGITGSITAANKVYDATDVATISGRSLTGVLGTDTVSYSGGAASFANKNVGNGKTVTGTGLVLAGADAGNYTVNSSATTTADITALGITGNITADNKVYDQTNTATILTRSLTGVLGTDVVSYSGGTATFSDKNVASGKTVSGSGLSLAGADAGNYTVNASATTTADITALGITGSITAGNKVYDATDLATITGRSLVGAIAGDVVSYSGGAASFSDKNAGTGKTVSGTGLTLTGADAGNYTVNTSATTTADITKAALTVSSIGQNKVYDATPSATVTLVDNRLGSDVLALGYGAASFNDKIIGAAKTVAVTGIALGGADAGNYSFNTTTSTTADIMALAITGSITAANKAYDASDAATITGRSVAGVLGADVVSYSGGTASFDNKNAGTGKTVTGTGLGLTGADAGNYTVNSTATTQADITPAPLDITANSATRVYGDANPTFAATYTGFQTGESAATLSGTLAFASPSVPSSNVGNYAIIPSGQSSTNYTISYINGTLSVAPVSLMVTADAKSKVYGTSDAVLTFGVTGLVNNPALGVVDTAGTVLSGTLTRAGGETVLGGPYAITQGSLVANSNYTLSSFAGNGLTITPAALNVAANSQNKIFGTSDPVLTFSVTGLVNNPALGIADTAGIVLSGALTRVPGESALGGPYAITQGSLAANSNYTLGFTLNNFTITGAAEEPVLGFNPGQIIYTGIINNDPYERPGNFWHISLNYNNADPGFDVMRGTGDLNSRSNRHSINCASVFGGGFCETWQFPQQFGEGDKKEAK